MAVGQRSSKAPSAGQLALHLIKICGDDGLWRRAQFADQHNRQQRKSKTRQHLVQPKPPQSGRKLERTSGSDTGGQQHCGGDRSL